MATVIFNGQAIIPAPFVSISKQYETADDGTVVGSLYQITLKGDIIAWKGSPNSTGGFWTQTGYPPDETSMTVTEMFGAITRKNSALRSLFSAQGALLELQPPDGSA